MNDRDLMIRYKMALEAIKLICPLGSNPYDIADKALLAKPEEQHEYRGPG